MIPKNITLTKKLVEALRQIKTVEGLSASEVTRRALEKYIKENYGEHVK